MVHVWTLLTCFNYINLFFQSLRNSHKCVGEVGFLQVKVLKANDLPATDLNGNLWQFISLYFYSHGPGLSFTCKTLLCYSQEKATLFVSLNLVTANFRLTQCIKPSIPTGTKPLHCKWDIWEKQYSDPFSFCTYYGITVLNDVSLNETDGLKMAIWSI